MDRIQTSCGKNDSLGDLLEPALKYQRQSIESDDGLAQILKLASALVFQQNEL